MSERAMSEALDAIHDEAMNLLQHDLPEEVKKRLDLIISIARYKSDIRPSQEKQNH